MILDLNELTIEWFTFSLSRYLDNLVLWIWMWWPPACNLRRKSAEQAKVHVANKGCARRGAAAPFVTDAPVESGDGSLLSHRRGGRGPEPAVRPGETGGEPGPPPAALCAESSGLIHFRICTFLGGMRLNCTLHDLPD